MENGQNVLLEMKFGTAFKIGAAFTLGMVLVLIVPWIIMFIVMSQTLPSF